MRALRWQPERRRTAAQPDPIQALDEEVIKSINFDNYPFDVVCLEVFPHDIWDKINEYLSSSVNRMMIEAGYSLQSVCGPTLIYLRKKSHHKQ